jgi:hypothetical protein
MSTGAQFVLICGLAVLGVVVGLLVVDAFSGFSDGWSSEGDEGGGEPRPAPKTPLAPKRLPDCLIPKLQPLRRAPTRQLEDA